MSDHVSEDQCKVCGSWPKAHRAELRKEHFERDYITIPIKSVCIRCSVTFWSNLTGNPMSEADWEELEQRLKEHDGPVELKIMGRH